MCDGAAPTRSTNISPPVYTRNNTPLPASDSTAAPAAPTLETPGRAPISVAAVSHRQRNQQKEQWAGRCFHMSVRDTFETARSVCGYRSEIAMTR